MRFESRTLPNFLEEDFTTISSCKGLRMAHSETDESALEAIIEDDVVGNPLFFKRGAAATSRNEIRARVLARRREAEHKAAEALRLEAEAKAKAEAERKAQAARDAASTCTCSHPGCSARFLREAGWVRPADLAKAVGDASKTPVVCWQHWSHEHLKVPVAVAAWKRAEVQAKAEAERKAQADADRRQRESAMAEKAMLDRMRRIRR
jgi:hypothetical protein